MFEVTSRKRVSTAVTEDFCYKVWIVESRNRGKAQTTAKGSAPCEVRPRPQQIG
jgi:hypothetical protein